MANPCNEKYNEEFDKCIYKAGQNLIQDKFNCTFGLLFSATSKTIKERIKECNLGDIANISPDNTFYGTLAANNQGRIILLQEEA